MGETAPLTTDDAFLGGGLRILQPAKGFRSGLDAVLLAASIPAKAGETVLEAGLGVGVASLCLARRVAGLTIAGLEAEAQMVALARMNAQRNALEDRLEIFEGRIENPPEALRKRVFDHVFANPPFLEAGEGVGARGEARAGARMGPEGMLAAWIDFCIRRTRPGGTITILHRADRLERVLAAFKGRCGHVKIFPVWPKVEMAAKRVIVRGTKESRAPLQLLPGLVLHDAEGRYLAQAENILRAGGALAALADVP